MNTKLFVVLAFAVVTAAVVTGMMIVGGPIQARIDRFDDQRLQDLNALARALLCEFDRDTDDRVLPEKLTIDAMRTHCSSAGVGISELTDSETGLGYTYHRIDDQLFSVCATFHDAERTARRASVFFGAAFDPSTGCISGRLR